MVVIMNFERLELNSDLLQAFAAIASTGHLTHAADQLLRTQSARSVQLKKLEDMLGARLFHRSPKGMILTAEGDKLLPLAQNILSQMHRAQAMFQAPLRGPLRIGIPDHYDDMVFEDVLMAFRRILPEVDVFTQSGCSFGFPQAIAEGRLDFAVVAGPGRQDGIGRAHV